jgi:hypothetical protein
MSGETKAICPECKGQATPMAHQPYPGVYTKYGCWACGNIFTVPVKKPANPFEIKKGLRRE